MTRKSQLLAIELIRDTYDYSPLEAVEAVTFVDDNELERPSRKRHRSSKPDAKPHVALRRIFGIVSVPLTQDPLVPEFVQRASIVEVKRRLSAAVKDDFARLPRGPDG